MALTRRACSWAETKSFLFLAWVPLILAIAVYFHQQCFFLFLSRTKCEKLSISIWSDVVFFSLAYFITILSFRSAVAAMITSLLLRAYSTKFCHPPLTESTMLTTPLPPSRLGTTAQSLISDVAHHGDNLSCFLIHFFHILFGSFNNPSTISNSWYHPCVYCLRYMLCI